MALNRRGIFFMMMAFVIISLFVLSVMFYSEFSSRASVQKRVETLSDFVSASEADLSRQLFITGYRAIFYMEKEIVDSGSYLGKDVNSVLEEIFFNGTINGREEPLLQQITFDRMNRLLSERAAVISADAYFSNPRIAVSQDDPWNVKFTFTSELFVADRNNLALWNKTQVTEVLISISNFTDPVYFVETAGNIAPPVFVRTPFEVFDSSSLNQHIQGKYYRAHDDAPSFLDRLEGNLFAGSSQGIESLVYVEDIPMEYRGDGSIVDYMYFSGAVSPHCHISGMQSWVRLDEAHWNYYGVSCG